MESNFLFGLQSSFFFPFFFYHVHCMNHITLKWANIEAYQNYCWGLFEHLGLVYIYLYHWMIISITARVNSGFCDYHSCSSSIPASEMSTLCCATEISWAIMAGYRHVHIPIRGAEVPPKMLWLCFCYWSILWKPWRDQQIAKPSWIFRSFKDIKSNLTSMHALSSWCWLGRMAVFWSTFCGWNF